MNQSAIRQLDVWVVDPALAQVHIGGGHTAPIIAKSVLVRVVTDDGAEGFGDSWLQQTDPRVLAGGIRYALEPLLIGQDSSQVLRLADRMWRAVRNHGLHPAISAVDIALWDLAGKRLGASVSALLGAGYRDRVEAYATMPWPLSPEEQADLIEQVVATGFRGVKVAVGHGVDADRARLRTLRSRHAELPLAIDANGAYDAMDAIRVGRVSDELDIRWFEEPCPYTDVAGLATVARAIQTPVSGFQSDASVYALRRYLEHDALAIFQPSVDKCGGITHGQRIAAVLDAYNKRFVPHSAAPPLAFAADLHLSAIAPTGGLMEFMVIDRNPENSRTYRMGPHLADPGLLDVGADGDLRVPTGPGLGVEIDRDRLAEVGRTLY